MELRDLISLLAALLTVGLPLAAIYFVLGRIGWLSRKGVMSDAFVIWIIWLLSGVAALIPIAIFDIEVRFSRRGTAFLSIPAVAAYLVSSISVFLAMRKLSDSRIEGITGSASENDRGQNASLRNVLLVSSAATLGLAIGIGAAILVNAGYDYLFPRKDNPFTIYDISEMTEKTVQAKKLRSRR